MDELVEALDRGLPKIAAPTDRRAVYKIVLSVAIKKDIEWWKWKPVDWVFIKEIECLEIKMFGDKPNEKL